MVIAGIAFYAFVYYYYNHVAKTIDQRYGIINPHAYKKPDVSLKKIRIKVFYVIPSNKTSFIAQNWQEQVAPTFDDLIVFYTNQFRGATEITYAFYPNPLILSHDNDYYDTDNTDHGNPKAFESIADEVINRVYKVGGDGYYASFVSAIPGEFVVNAFIYEGVGASGAPGAVFASRSFFVRDEYIDMRATILAHEFGHALGLPDQYDIKTDNAFSNDLMGAGRRDILKKTYIDRALMKDFGVGG
jgi:M6 family metalloprotease-like protein